MSTVLDAWLLPEPPELWVILDAIRANYLSALDRTSGRDWPDLDGPTLAPKHAQLIGVALEVGERWGRGYVMRLPHWVPWDTEAILDDYVNAQAVARLHCDTRTDPEPGDVPSDHPLVDYVDKAIRARRYWLWPLIDQDDLDRWRRT